LDFNCVQADVTGVHTGADLSGCKGAIKEKSGSLIKAVHTLKPEVNAKAEAKNAEKQAQDDLKAAGA
jgi:translation elongation factor EF-Ts